MMLNELLKQMVRVPLIFTMLGPLMICEIDIGHINDVFI